MVTGDDGSQCSFRSGDAFVSPAGFTGTWEIAEPAKKLYAYYGLVLISSPEGGEGSQTEARQFTRARTISPFLFAGRPGEVPCRLRFRRLRLPDRALTGAFATCGWISIVEARPPVIIEASTLVAS